MVIDVLRAYKIWKKSSPAASNATFVDLVGSAMEYSDDLTKVITPAMVMDSVSKGTGNRGMGIIVSGAWVRYNVLRPSGPAAVEEAAVWIARLIAGPERHAQFVAVLDDLFIKAGFGPQLKS